MSSSMYAALEKSDNETESIAFASAMEEDVTEDPFLKQHVTAGNDSDFEPLHAVDAARRLLDSSNDTDAQQPNAPVEATDPAPFAMMGAMGGVSQPESRTPVMGGIDATSNVQMASSSGQMRNSSLLERIQQQKKHQPAASTSINTTQSTSATTMNAATTTNAPTNFTTTHNYAPSSTGTFPEGNYSYASGPTSAPASTTTSNTLNIPQYSSTPRPNPYDTSSDYKDKMMNVLSAAGSVANTAAKSAVSGTKYLYNNLIHKTATSGGRQSNLGGGGGGRMGEMDYQRESLLMDPHDLENSAAAFSSSTNNQEQFQQQQQQQRPPGMRSMSGLDGSISFEQQQQPSEASRTNAILISLKQFMVDMKDLFLAAPRSAQITVIGVFVLILWLLFSEV